MSWAWLSLGSERFLVFRYADPQAGPSAKGVELSGDAPTEAQIRRVAESPRQTFRLPMGTLTPLDSDEVEQFGLPAQPDWMRFYTAAEPVTDRPWRVDSGLAGAFHPGYPDDLQTLFHFPAVRRVELMWVRLTGADQEVGGYRGILLNDAHADGTLVSGSEATVRVTPGVDHPVWVSPTVRDNLSRYRGACLDCGFDLVLTPIDALVAATFPDAPTDAALEMFTTRCANCTGTQTLTAVG